MRLTPSSRSFAPLSIRMTIRVTAGYKAASTGASRTTRSGRSRVSTTGGLWSRRFSTSTTQPSASSQRPDLRYYIPAYIVADIRQALQTADPVFHLTHGFVDFSATMEVGGETFIRASGRTRLINPLRYGALTFLDYARHRLSVFCREEAAAILAYLEFAHEAPWHEYSREAIERAIADFWKARAGGAPDRGSLQRHNAEERAFSDAILRRRES